MPDISIYDNIGIHLYGENKSVLHMHIHIHVFYIRIYGNWNITYIRIYIGISACSLINNLYS